MKIWLGRHFQGREINPELIKVESKKTFFFFFMKEEFRCEPSRRNVKPPRWTRALVLRRLQGGPDEKDV